MRKFITLITFCFVCTFTFGQASWQPLPNIPVSPSRYDDVFFLTDSLGWAADGAGTAVYKTTDAGATWQLQFTDSTSYFRNIEFLNANIGFLGTLSAEFYKTADGGNSWQLVNNITPNPPAICGLDAVGTSTIYGCGAYFSPAWIIKSVDSGNSWQYIDMSQYASALVEILFVDDSLGYVSGRGVQGDGVILKTIDGGQTWTKIYDSGVQGDIVWKMQLLNNNNYLYGSVQAYYFDSTGTGKLIKSFDKGNTWVTKPFPDPLVQAVGFITPAHGWMGGHHTGFYETLDGGTTWTNTGIGSMLNRIFFVNDTLAYAAGATIYKFSSTLSVNDFEEVPPPRDVKISIAPVPVIDKLKVKIEFKHPDNLTIDLYDAKGQLITRLLRDLSPTAGTKTYTFDFPYASGTYFLDFHYNSGRRSYTIIKK